MFFFGLNVLDDLLLNKKLILHLLCQTYLERKVGEGREVDLSI